MTLAVGGTLNTNTPGVLLQILDWGLGPMKLEKILNPYLKLGLSNFETHFCGLFYLNLNSGLTSDADHLVIG